MTPVDAESFSEPRCRRPGSRIWTPGDTKNHGWMSGKKRLPWDWTRKVRPAGSHPWIQNTVCHQSGMGGNSATRTPLLRKTQTKK